MADHGLGTLCILDIVSCGWDFFLAGVALHDDWQAYLCGKVNVWVCVSVCVCVQRAIIVCRLLFQRFLHIGLLSRAYFEIIIGDILLKLAWCWSYSGNLRMEGNAFYFRQDVIMACHPSMETEHRPWLDTDCSCGLLWSNCRLFLHSNKCNKIILLSVV